MDKSILRDVAVVIPALNEVESLPHVLAELPVSLEVVVVDNGSTDDTAAVARAMGARVVREPRRGYGYACLAGIAALPSTVRTVVFIDADHADHPEELPRLLRPIVEDEADLVVGSRLRGPREPGAMAWHALFGNWLAALLIRLLHGVYVTDIGPFRAIRRSSLETMQMQPGAYFWTTEMLVKGARLGLRVVEVPVSYRARVGRSKISGTLRGSLLAGRAILGTIFRYRNWSPQRDPVYSEGRLGDRLHGPGTEGLIVHGAAQAAAQTYKKKQGE